MLNFTKLTQSLPIDVICSFAVPFPPQRAQCLHGFACPPTPWWEDTETVQISWEVKFNRVVNHACSTWVSDKKAPAQVRMGMKSNYKETLLKRYRLWSAVLGDLLRGHTLWGMLTRQGTSRVRDSLGKWGEFRDHGVRDVTQDVQPEDENGGGREATIAFLWHS